MLLFKRKSEIRDEDTGDKVNVSLEISGKVVDNNGDGSHDGAEIDVNVKAEYKPGDEGEDQFLSATAKLIFSEDNELFQFSIRTGEPLTDYGICLGPKVCSYVYEEAINAYIRVKEIEIKSMRWRDPSWSTTWASPKIRSMNGISSRVSLPEPDMRKPSVRV